MSRKSNDSTGTGCIVMGFLMIFLAPVFALILLSKDNEDDKVLGVIILIVWIIFAFIYGSMR